MNKEERKVKIEHMISKENASKQIKNIEVKTSSRWHKIRSFFKETYNKRIMWMYLITSFLITIIIEILGRKDLFAGAFYFLISAPYIFLVNMLIVLMTLSLTLLMRRRIFGMSVISVLWLIFGVSNCIVIHNRTNPFGANDLWAIDSAFGVLNKYFNWIEVAGVIALLILAIAGVVWLFFKAPKVNHKINYVRNIFAIILIWAIGFGSIYLGVGTGLFPKQFGNLVDAYQRYGFVYCFSNSVVNTGVDQPKNYSKKTMKAYKNKNKINPDDASKPNIIFLQLESFFDMNKLTNIKMSEDPTPNFNALKKKYPSGYLTVPIVGAGTVNTEFEILTGMNLQDFGPGEYPFKTILKKKPCESICFNLKPFGYKRHAIHNNTATFYDRNIVFSNLGFNTFTSIETMDEVEKTDKDWAKDKCLTPYIMEALKSTPEQDFIYTISVQGHGAYLSNDNNGASIKVSGIEDHDLKNQYEYYATQINEMDKFVKDLTTKLSNFKEKTILVMYGDHLPSLAITADQLVNKSVYQTEYIIWSNYKTNYDNEDIHSFEMEPKILEKLGIKKGEINYYSQKHRKDKDQEAYLEGLHKLEYDQLYGKNYAHKGKKPYKATKLKFGLHKVKIKSINPMYNDVGTTYIYGENFTPYSRVYINGKKYQTFYMDRSTVIIQYPDLKAGDKIRVYQQNSDENVLSKTKKFIYTPEETNPSAQNTKKSKKK